MNFIDFLLADTPIVKLNDKQIDIYREKFAVDIYMEMMNPF